jgi:hypothetical protein
MRTSGAGSDSILFIIPIGVLVFMGVMYLGGPSEFLRHLDQMVIDGFNWVSRALR